MKLNSRIWLEVQEYNKYLLAATNSESALSQE